MQLASKKHRHSKEAPRGRSGPRPWAATVGKVKSECFCFDPRSELQTKTNMCGRRQSGESGSGLRFSPDASGECCRKFRSMVSEINVPLVEGGRRKPSRFWSPGKPGLSEKLSFRVRETSKCCLCFCPSSSSVHSCSCWSVWVKNRGNQIPDCVTTVSNTICGSSSGTIKMSGAIRRWQSTFGGVGSSPGPNFTSNFDRAVEEAL